MNLDELRSVQAKERRKDSLQHLRDAFYDNVAAYLADLRAARDRRAGEVDNPFSDDDVRRMSDEIETAEEVAEALYERRVGKVVKLASFAAADMPVETEGMTSQERALFEDLVERIGANKSVVLEALSGATTPGGQGANIPAGNDPDPTPDTTADPAADPAPESGGALAEAMGAAEPPADREQHADREPPADPSAPPKEPPGTEPEPSALDPDPGAVDADPGAIADPEPDAVDNSGHPQVAPGVTDSPSSDSDGPVPVDPEPAPPGAVDTDSTADAPGEPMGDGGSAAASASDVDRNGVVPSTTSSPSTSSPQSTSSSPSPSTPGDEGDRMTVRITADVGEIFGTDEREYHLTSEDVVSLPSANAEPLLKRDAAEPIE